MTVSFELAGHDFLALNGGPVFRFTPAISFYVACKTEAEVERLFGVLSDGGSVLMPLAKYPFSEKYAWVNDKFGVSWQLNFVGTAQKITPALMFTGSQSGKAEEAINFYVSNFPGSSIGMMARYAAGEGDVEGTLKHAKFSLHGQDFIAMDSSREHAFNFSPAISFILNCDTQEELDQRWQQLSATGEGQCGWISDKFGVSWQLVPTALGEMLQDKSEEKSGRVMHALLKMSKLDINLLQEAFDQA